MARINNETGYCKRSKKIWKKEITVTKMQKKVENLKQELYFSLYIPTESNVVGQ